MIDRPFLQMFAPLLIALCFLVACGDDGTDDAVESSSNTSSACESDLNCDLGLFCISGQCAPSGSECVENADCDDFFECSSGYCVEIARECEDDSACPDANICIDYRCVTGCREDGDCGEGKICSDELLRCVDPPPMCPDTCPQHQQCVDPQLGCVPDGTCSASSDCTDGLVCNDGVCGDPILSCDDDRDCTFDRYCADTSLCEVGCRNSGGCFDGEYCIENQCTPGEPPACDADALEPNDEVGEASQLNSLGDVLSDQTFCDDADWFGFNARAGDEIEISLTFTHSQGDLNMRLYTPQNEILQFSGTQNDNESILLRDLNLSGQYHVEVYGANRAVYTNYALELRRERNCNEDVNEDNDEPAEATAISGISAQLTDQTICGDDSDWFSVSLYPGEILTAGLTFSADDGELELERYDAAGDALEQTSSAGQLVWTADLTGNTLLRVPGSPELINAYDLDIEITVPACEADGLEPNDTAGAASDITSNGTAIEGTICANDVDWYRLSLPADAEANVALTFSHDVGDLNLAVFNSGDLDTPVAAADTDDDNEALSFRPPLPGTYFVRVSATGRLQSSYSISLVATSPVCPEDDFLEENDDFDNASALSPGINPGLISCEGDEDWFTFELAEGQSVEIFTLAAMGLGDLDLRLYGPDADDPDAAPVDSSTGPGEVKRVRAVLGSTPGTYKVRVNASAGTAVVYSARIFIYDGPLPLDCEFDDTFEPNDTPAAARNILTAQTVEAIVCGNNEDWFRIDVIAGNRVNVRVDFLHAEGNLDAQLLRGQSVIASAESETDNEYLSFLAEATETLFLKLSLTGEDVDGNRYQVTVSQIAGEVELDCTFDDPFEQNDSAEEAAPIEAGISSAALCANDDDFFTVTVGANQTLTVTLLHDSDPDDVSLSLSGTNSSVDALQGERAALRASFSPSFEEEVTVAVISNSSQPVFYSLNLELSDDALSFCGDPDALEPNTEPAESTLLTEPTDFADLGLCEDDEDWFQIDVPADQQLVVEATFDSDGGNLDLFAFDSSGQGLSASQSTTGVERLVIPGDDEGRTVVIRALLSDRVSQDLRYDLTMYYEDQTIGGACVEDDYEPNNTASGAASLSSGSYTLSLCGDDSSDWFTTDAPMFPNVLTIIVEFDPMEADLGIEGADLTLMFPGVVTESSGRLELSFPLSLLGGAVQFRVFNNNPATGGAYTLDVFNL